jgi:hypothetical protein
MVKYVLIKTYVLCCLFCLSSSIFRCIPRSNRTCLRCSSDMFLLLLDNIWQFFYKIHFHSLRNRWLFYIFRQYAYILSIYLASFNYREYVLARSIGTYFNNSSHALKSKRKVKDWLESNQENVQKHWVKWIPGSRISL